MSKSDSSDEQTDDKTPLRSRTPLSVRAACMNASSESESESVVEVKKVAQSTPAPMEVENTKGISRKRPAGESSANPKPKVIVMGESACMGTSEKDESVNEYLEEMRAISDRLRSFILSDGNKVSKHASTQILRALSEHEGVLVKLMCENASLRGRLGECEKERENLRMNARVAPSAAPFASVVARANSVNVTKAVPQQGKPRVNARPSFALIVKGGENETQEQLLTKLKAAPGCENVRVSGVRAARTGGVVIETLSVSEREKLKAAASGTSLKAEVPSLLRPRIVMYDVPGEMTDERLLAGLYEKNMSRMCDRSEFQKSVSVASRNSRPNTATGNVILDVSPRVRDWMLSERRMYIEWGAYRVARYEVVSRCYSCYSYAHVLRDCKTERLCFKCGRAGHKGADCKAQPDCGNCRARGLKSGHSVLSPDCPEYKWRLERLRTRIMP